MALNFLKLMQMFGEAMGLSNYRAFRSKLREFFFSLLEYLPPVAEAQ